MQISFNDSQFKAALDRAINEEVEKEKLRVVRELCIIGEQCVNQARISERKGRDYQDQTGNLRASVGYIVVCDGEICELAGFDDTKEGASVGREYAQKLAANHPQGFALIVVAGMNYAEYVAAKGYDVLDSAELLAERLCKEICNEC